MTCSRCGASGNSAFVQDFDAVLLCAGCAQETISRPRDRANQSRVENTAPRRRFRDWLFGPPW